MSVLFMTLNSMIVTSSDAGAMENAEYLSIAIAAPDKAISMGYIEQIAYYMLHWIVWIRAVWLNWIA